MDTGLSETRTSVKTQNLSLGLWKIRHRDKKTKRIKGSFWIWTDTPGKFNLEKYSQFLEENGLEVCPISE